MEDDSGAQKAGLQSGDIIKQIDNVRINKFADLSGYISSKRLNDTVQVSILRNDKELVLPVVLTKTNTYDIKRLGIRVKKATKKELRANKAANGVVISEPLNRDMAQFKGLFGRIITEIDDKEINSIEDVQRIMDNYSDNDAISIVFLDTEGKPNRFIFE